jgi:hypothetical protein
MQKRVRYQLITLLAFLYILALLGGSLPTAAAPLSHGQSLKDSPQVIFRAVHIEGGSPRRVLPSAEYFSKAAAKTATITVNYTGPWPDEARAAFEFAKGIWETSLSSPVPIVVNATWENLTAKYGSPYILGGAGAADYYRDFSGAPLAGTWYPLALANKIFGGDLDPGSDIEASFNSAFPSWYFGIDGDPPGIDKYDFASVVLHEIGHGLGFSGSMVWSGGSGNWGRGSNYPFVFDKFVANGSGQNLLDTNVFPNFSSALGSQLISGNLYFNGSHAVTANGGSQGPKLYAPASWEQGSSYSHLDEGTYSNASGNSLMTPSLTNDEVIHIPGLLTIAIFEDIGWNTASTPLPTVTPTYNNITFLPTLLIGFKE